MRNATRMQWIILLIALCAWAAVGFFWWSISDEAASRGARVMYIQDTEDKGAAAERLHSLMQDTVAQRAQIIKLLHAEIVSVVDLIEATGGATAKVTVSDAHPETASGLRAVNAITGIVVTGFTIEAQGRFADLMRIAQLLENLPVPSTVGRIELLHAATADGASKDSWHMTVYLRVFTIPETR